MAQIASGANYYNQYAKSKGLSSDRYASDVTKALISNYEKAVKQQIWKDPINNLPKALGMWLHSKGVPAGLANFFGSKLGLYGTLGGLVAAPLLFGLFRRKQPQPDYSDEKFQSMLNRALQMNAQRRRSYA